MNEDVQIQMMGGSYGVPGSLSRLIDHAGRFNFSRLRPIMESKNPVLAANATLRKDEWEELDSAVLEVATKVLNGIPDLKSAGLARNLGGIGTTISQYEQQSDMEDAEVRMSVRAGGEEDTTEFTLISVPVPVVSKEFRIDARTLDASRRMGSSLDTTNAATATRKVAEKLEDILFNGASNIVVNANPLYGYTTQTYRNTVSGGDWGTLSNVYSNILSCINEARSDNMRGPFTLYVATTQFGQMFEIYSDGTGQTGYERVLAKLPQLSAIKEAPQLTDEAVMVQLSSDVVDLVMGLDIVTLQWDTMGGMETRFKVMAIMAPRVKSDANNQSGVVHLSSI